MNDRGGTAARADASGAGDRVMGYSFDISKIGEHDVPPTNGSQIPLDGPTLFRESMTDESNVTGGHGEQSMVRAREGYDATDHDPVHDKDHALRTQHTTSERRNENGGDTVSSARETSSPMYWDQDDWALVEHANGHTNEGKGPAPYGEAAYRDDVGQEAETVTEDSTMHKRSEEGNMGRPEREGQGKSEKKRENRGTGAKEYGGPADHGVDFDAFAVTNKTRRTPHARTRDVPAPPGADDDEFGMRDAMYQSTPVATRQGHDVPGGASSRRRREKRGTGGRNPAPTRDAWGAPVAERGMRAQNARGLSDVRHADHPHGRSRYLKHLLAEGIGASEPHRDHEHHGRRYDTSGDEHYSGRNAPSRGERRESRRRRGDYAGDEGDGRMRGGRDDMSRGRGGQHSDSRRRIVRSRGAGGRSSHGDTDDEGDKSRGSHGGFDQESVDSWKSVTRADRDLPDLNRARERRSMPPPQSGRDSVAHERRSRRVKGGDTTRSRSETFDGPDKKKLVHHNCHLDLVDFDALCATVSKDLTHLGSYMDSVIKATGRDPEDRGGDSQESYDLYPPEFYDKLVFAVNDHLKRAVETFSSARAKGGTLIRHLLDCASDDSAAVGALQEEVDELHAANATRIDAARQSALDDVHDEMNALRERAETAERKQRRMTSHLQMIVPKIEAVEQERARAASMANDLRAQRSELQTNLEDIEDKLRVAETKVTTMNAELSGIKVELSDRAVALDRARRELVEVEDRRAKEVAEHATLAEESGRLRRRLDDMGSVEKRAVQELDRSERRVVELKRDLDTLTARFESQMAELRSSRDELLRERERADNQRDRADRLEREMRLVRTSFDCKLPTEEASSTAQMMLSTTGALPLHVREPSYLSSRPPRVDDHSGYDMTPPREPSWGADRSGGRSGQYDDYGVDDDYHSREHRESRGRRRAKGRRGERSGRAGHPSRDREEGGGVRDSSRGRMRSRDRSQERGYDRASSAPSSRSPQEKTHGRSRQSNHHSRSSVCWWTNEASDDSRSHASDYTGRSGSHSPHYD